MKSFLKIIILGLVLCLVGCNTKVSNIQGSNNSKTKISLATWAIGAVPKESETEKYIEEAFPDIDIELILLERSNWKEQINARVAGGQIPDIIVRADRTEVTDYVAQNLLAKVPYDMIKQFAPRVYKAINDFGKETWLVTTEKGENYGIPIVSQGNLRANTNGYRLDWLKNVGIDKVPTTLDEMEAALSAFVNKDPDKNGKKDTYGMSAIGKDSLDRSFTSVFGAYGVFPDKWMITEEGKLEFGAVTQGSRKALIKLNEWYKKGIIDPEFMTTDMAILKQKWSNSKIGFVESQYYRLFGPQYEGDKGGEYYASLKAVNPNGEISEAYAPIGPGGSYGYPNWGKLTAAITFNKALEKNNEKLQKCIKLTDALMADLALNKKIAFGQEGVHWVLNNKTNMPKYIPPYDVAEERAKLGINILSIGRIPEIENLGTGITPEKGKELWRYAVEGNLKDGRDYIPWANQFFPTSSAQYIANTRQVAIKWSVDFITGSKSIDQFDNFVAEWNKSGGTELTLMANEFYKKLEADKKTIESATK